MKKSDILNRIASEALVTKLAADAAFNVVFSSIGEALARGESVTIAGFGTFSAKRRPARTGRNPRTGEPIAIGASNTVSFKTGKALKDSMN